MYTVYKIINTLNEKFYIGVHKTNNPNDGYFGSGKAIKEAIKLYGKENFKKEILYITENEKEAYSVEKELTSNFSDRNNYNMRLGGIGGFTVERGDDIAKADVGVDCGEAQRDKVFLRGAFGAVAFAVVTLVAFYLESPPRPDVGGYTSDIQLRRPVSPM